MSDFQTFVREQLAFITGRLNSIETNGKKIDEVPPQIILNPNSRIHVSIDGVSQRLDISQIIQAATNGNYNQLLSVGNITVVSGEIKVPAGATWVIDNVNYTTSSETSIPISLADTGMNRIDILVANNLGQIVLINGIETSSIAVRPNIPPDNVLVTQVNISDSDIGSPTDPFIGVQFQTKLEKSEVEITDSGVYSEINVGFENSAFRFTGGITEIQSFSYEPEYLVYPGKEVIFKNFQSVPFTIKHLSVSGTGTHQFYNPSETDLIVQPGEIAVYSISDISNRLELLSINKIFNSGDYYTASEVDALIVGLWDDRGSFDASVNAYPSSGGSGASGAIKKGDIWTVSVAGTLPTAQVVEIGDTVRALIDTPGNTQANWAIQQNNIGYVPENSVNKSTSIAGNETSNVLFPTIKAFYDYLIGMTWLTSQIFGTWINGLTSKPTPVDADSISIVDSADGNKQKKVSLTNFKAFFKTYFDTLYSSKQALYFYTSSSTTTFTSDQKNMHISRFNAGTLFGSFGLTLGSGIPETSGVIDMSYLGDVGVPMIVPFNCVVEEVFIRYSRNVSESGANSDIMFRMMSDTSYNVNNQMICDYNLTGSTHLANVEVSVPVTVASHSTITKGGGLKFCVRTNNATAQQFNIFRIMVIVKKV